jgi:hypothetical protein
MVERKREVQSVIRRRIQVGLAIVGMLLLWDFALAGMIGGPAASRGVLVSTALADDDDDDDDDKVRPPRRQTFAREPRTRRPPPVPPRELLAAGITDADVARLRDAGFTVVAARRLSVLPEITVRLRIPRHLSERRAVERLRTLVPPAIIDFNHLYRPGAPPCPDADCFRFTASGAPLSGTCAVRGRIGMIDTGIDTKHAALSRMTIEVESARGPDHPPSRSEHGTEIAMLLVAAIAPTSDFSLVGVDAFHRRGAADYADAFDIVAALDRLIAKGVTVINLSFAGPPNALLDRAGDKAAERGAIIVAAAGNDGPTASPRYPAGYRWAIAVTAVDRRDQIYVRAVRGPHIAFAAAGVRVQVPDRGMQPGAVRSGTSYAVPRVTAAIAAARTVEPNRSANTIVTGFARDAKDLGAPGRDPVFGWGLIDLRKACPHDRNADDGRR